MWSPGRNRYYIKGELNAVAIISLDYDIDQFFSWLFSNDFYLNAVSKKNFI